MDEASADAKWEQWRRDIVLISKEIDGLMESDARFRLSMKALEEWPPERINVTYDWIVLMYARDAAVQIRRMLDRTKHVKSLLRLIEDIQSHPSVASRERFVASYVTGLGATARQGSGPTPESNIEDWKATAGREFDQHAGEHRGYWPSSEAASDIATLTRAGNARGLQDLTNTRITHHRPQQELTAQPIWRDTHECIAVLHRVSRRYTFLLLQEDRPVWSSSTESLLEGSVRRFWLGDGTADESTSSLD